MYYVVIDIQGLTSCEQRQLIANWTMERYWYSLAEQHKMTANHREQRKRDWSVWCHTSGDKSDDENRRWELNTLWLRWSLIMIIPAVHFRWKIKRSGKPNSIVTEEGRGYQGQWLIIVVPSFEFLLSVNFQMPRPEVCSRVWVFILFADCSWFYGARPPVLRSMPPLRMRFEAVTKGASKPIAAVHLLRTPFPLVL